MELSAIQPGMKNEACATVTEELTAKAMGSGSLPVYATPAMTCLMEQAAADLVEPLLPEGWTSVGISLSIQHLSATPIGAKVRAVAQITAVEDRKITYSVTACDEAGEIGRGTHERFAVARETFLAKASQKARQA